LPADPCVFYPRRVVRGMSIVLAAALFLGAACSGERGEAAGSPAEPAAAQRTQRPLGTGMTVGTNQGHAGVNDTQLGRHHVHDALARIIHINQLDVGLTGGFAGCLDKSPSAWHQGIVAPGRVVEERNAKVE